MDTVLTVADCLKRIFELREAIRHQRYVNKKTYLRLVEIHVEIQVLQRDGTFQDNAMLRRTAIFKRFDETVRKFERYLNKYHDMYRVVRIFKVSEMEEQRLEIVDDVDHLFRMLGLATSATVIKGAYDADKNAAKFLAKLKKIDKHVKLTHDKVQAALLKLVEERAAERKSMRVPKVIRERTQAPQEPMAEPEPEEVKNKALVSPGPRVLESNEDNVSAKPTAVTTLTDPAPVSITAAVTEAVDEKEDILDPLGPELCQSSAQEICQDQVASSVGEEADTKEPDSALIENISISVNNSPTESMSNAGSEFEEKEPTTEQAAVAKTQEDDTVADNQELALKPYEDGLSSSTSVKLLVSTLKSCEVGALDTETTLLRLIRTCVSSSNRVQVFKTGGIPILSRLVKKSGNYFTQLYALHCLSWFTFSYSKMREIDFEKLRALVCDAPRQELLRLLDDLQHGEEKEKEAAVIRCSCMATRGDADALRCVGVLSPLIAIVSDGTDNQKLWAAEALASLASNNDQNCVEIAREGAIQPLVALLRSGTDLHKQEAAYALGILAASNDENRSKIAREGAIPPMVAFVKAETDAQNQWAVYALGCLCLNNEANRIAIGEEEDSIPGLVGLVRVGTKAQKQWAAYTLGNLALNDLNRAKITMEGAIKPLVALLQIGTDAQKRWAAYALGNLSCGSIEPSTSMALKEAVLLLVELVRTGSDQCKQTAAYTLGDLAANSDDIQLHIGREGAILPLVMLLHTGNDEQKECAAYALGCLADDNNNNRSAIIEAGATELLEALVETGTKEQNAQAKRALKLLRVKTRREFLPRQLIAPVMGFIWDGVNSQKPNVTAALNKLENVCDSAIPLLHDFIMPRVESPQKLKLTEPQHESDDTFVDSRGGNSPVIADAW